LQAYDTRAIGSRKRRTASPFDPLLDRAHRHATAFFHDLPDRFVGARAGREEMMAALDAPLPRHGPGGGASGCAAPRYFTCPTTAAWPSCATPATTATR
jgi:hypothetical protein